MTKRERIEAVINGNITEEVIEGFKAELVKMDESLEKAKNRKNPHKEANEAIKEQIVEFLNTCEESMLIDPIVESIGEGVTRQRVSTLCTQLISEGKLIAEDVKVKGKGKRKAYRIA